ncbi:MAG: hypothetical protein HC892_10050 [Saprospiraceae bacterium]|nr:hypothetical protein [Saprospiraceae bacterium]
MKATTELQSLHTKAADILWDIDIELRKIVSLNEVILIIPKTCLFDIQLLEKDIEYIRLNIERLQNKYKSIIIEIQQCYEYKFRQ